MTDTDLRHLAEQAIGKDWRQADGARIKRQFQEAADPQTILALLDERDSFKRLMLVAGGRVTALKEPVLANIDEALSFLVQRVDDYYVEQARTALNRARALLAAAPSEPQKACPDCGHDVDHDTQCPAGCPLCISPAALPAEDEDIPEAFGRLVPGRTSQRGKR